MAPRAFVIDLEGKRRADLERALLDLAEVHVEIAGALLRVGDREAHPFAGHRSGVADLTSGFGVERGLVEDDRTALALLERGHRLAVAHKRSDRTGGAFGLIAEEIGAADVLAQGEPHRFVRRFAGAGPRRSRLLALALHGVGERGEIDTDTARLERVLGEIERKAVSVVERECCDAVEHGAALELFALLVEDRKAALERAAEARLLELERLGDQRLGALQFRIGQAHLAHQHRHQPPHQRLFLPEQLGMAHGAAHDAPKHVAAALVRRQHAVGDQERGGAQMVGDDAMRGLARTLGVDAGEVGDRLDERAEQIDLVIVVRTLQHRGDALEPHAGVDRRPRQVDALAAGELLVLHEHQVPDFDETVAVGVRASRRSARYVRAVIVEDLRARAARPGVSHGPEIVRPGNAPDPALGQPGDLFPEIERLVVVDIDRDHQAIGRHAELFGHQPPRELDGAFLEVVAEREIAQHLEEGVVARGVADIVEIVVLAAGAHAFLRRDRPRVGALLQAGEEVLELHHAGIGEHQRRIVARHERRRGHDFVPLARKIGEEIRSDFVDAAHLPQLSSGAYVSCPGRRNLQDARKAYKRSHSDSRPGADWQ